jgi:hypothetical protein
MTFWRIVAGAEALVLMLAAWALWRLCDVLAAQSRKLSDSAVTLRLYRESRTDSDRQIRALLDQNERLARQLIDRAAESTTTPIIAVPQHFFHAKRES